MSERPRDDELEKSTNRWMIAGITLTGLFVLMFPAYRLYEPSGRESARTDLAASLVAQGGDIFQASCASCHGVSGEGVDAPALNSQQFLASADDEQIVSLISHGIPGTEMSPYSLDFGGFLTSQQIKAVAGFIRSWEPDAPDRPDWRSFVDGAEGGHDEGGAEPDGHDEEAGGVFDPAEVFAASCARCHGADLSGGTGPALGPGSHAVSDEDGELIRAIRTGPDEMPRFDDDFTPEQIEEILAYIREVQSSG
jgi:quinol---cytochrome-c reductase cytochrome c subunit